MFDWIAWTLPVAVFFTCIVVLLAVIGIGSEKGVAFGLLLFLIVALDSLIGGVLFLVQKLPRPAPAI